MGTGLIILGVIFGFVSIIILYAILCISMIKADYWWQKFLCILVMFGVPIILIIVGAIMTLNS